MTREQTQRLTSKQPVICLIIALASLTLIVSAIAGNSVSSSWTWRQPLEKRVDNSRAMMRIKSDITAGPGVFLSSSENTKERDTISVSPCCYELSQHQ